MMKRLLLFIYLISFVALSGSLNAQNETIYPAEIITPVHFDISKPLRDVKIIPPGERKRSWKENTIKNKFGFLEEFKTPSEFQGPDPVLQDKDGQMTSAKAIVQNFDGVSNLNGVAPPDTDGDVGPNHYFQMINLSFQIFNKSGVSLYGPADNQTLWEGFDNGQPFDNANDGDPIVIYDEYADRWLASQFVLNSTNSYFYELVAVSATPDPTGAWYRYAFQFTNFPDYPKIGVWRDGYYMAINQFANASTWAGGGAVVMDRDAMIAGNPTATMVFFNLGTSYGSLLPADADGATLPPAGAPGYFVNMSTNLLRVWNLSVNWTTPSSSTITLAANLTTASFTYSGISVAQPGTTTVLDNLSDRLMFRLQYRNFGTHQSMVTNHSVNVGSSRAGVRWYELRNTGSGWTIYQQGTYAPADGRHRWMGSIAMNANGDIGLGYSVSSSSTYPSIRYTGRLAGDALGTMTLTEQSIYTGTASQTGVSRWGDYSAMTIDPVDDYTFWYTTEYSTGGWNWRTRIASFQFGTVPLIAQFTASQTSICSGSSVTFTDQSIGSPTGWTWSFPGGTPSSYSGANPPAIVYSTPGTYDVTLVVTKGTGSDTETKTGYITVQNVIANFTGTPTTVVVGNTVTFTDNSSCSPTAWSWTFTGGTPSTATGQGPHVITYNTIGTYNVSLTVTKSSSNDTETKTGYISVISSTFNMTNATITTCSGNFYDSGGSSGAYANNENFTETFYPATPGAKIRFVFSSFSTESGYDYLRIYDGTSTGATLIGTYNGTTGPGTVTATNASGALTFNFTSDYSVTSTGWAASISCIGGTLPPVANFSASTTTPNVGATVTFTDQSTNTPTSWSWSFSPATVTYMGGTTSASQNPQVRFNAAGYYTVTLTATNAGGSDGETKTNYILATAPPVANFSASTTTPYIGQLVTFTDLSTNTPTSWAWSFSPTSVTYVGGTTSASQNPQVQFTAGGPYTVTLTATNAAGSDPETKNNYISVLYAPVANFSASTTTPYIGQTVTFTDLSTNTPTSWAWVFSPATVTYTGGTTSASQNPQVQFNAGGLYTVTLTATNASGSDPEVKNNYISVLFAPVANFSANNTTPNLGQTVTFTDQSTNTPTSWAWSFSPSTITYTGGTTASSQNPQVQFNAGGFYTVTLTAINASGSDEETKTNYISVTAPPVANFSSSTTTPNAGQTVTFSDLSTNIPTSWLWSFTPGTVSYVAGTTSASQNPQVQFTAGGLYSVTLTATNAAGSDSETKIDYILVTAPPVADFSADITAPGIGQTVTFTDLSVNGATLWAWSFLPSTVTFVGGTNAMSQDPQVQFDAPGAYTVELTVSNAAGSDVESKTDYITVIAPPVADFTADNTNPNVGNSVNFTDLSSGNPTTWSWIFIPTTVTYLGGTTSGSQNPQVQFDAPGLYIVELTVSNASGSDTETKTDYILVINPVINLDITVYLEGPFNGADMSVNLTNLPEFPLIQPYGMAPWSYGGSENVAVIPNANIVDWILVELRDAADAASATSATMMDRQAAFLLNNGTVVGLDGTSMLQFVNSLTQQLFVVIWHRNHLGVMSSDFVSESGGTYSYNFSTDATQAYGSTDAHKQIGPGVWGMMGGDGNRDGEVTDTDKFPIWESQAGTQGYLESDYNLDTQSDNKDKDDVWTPNLGAGSPVPQ